MFKAKGSQQQMILFPMEKGPQHFGLSDYLNYKFNLSYPFIRHF
jgi:hypothetical protein